MLFRSSSPPNFNYGYNGDLVGRVNEAYETQMEGEREKDRASNTDTQMAEHISTGHKNFLRNAVYFLYLHNRMKEAAKWYNLIKNRIIYLPESIIFHKILCSITRGLFWGEK